MASAVEEVNVRMTDENTCDFNAAVCHADEGRKHYADKWDGVGPGSTVLGTRTLVYPQTLKNIFRL
jgi:hypothetical protein